MAWILLLAVACAQVAASSPSGSTCGEIRDLYRSSECCGAPEKATDFNCHKAVTYLPPYEDILCTMYPDAASVPDPACVAPETELRVPGKSVKVPDTCCSAGSQKFPVSALLPFRPGTSCPAFTFGEYYQGMAYLGCDGDKLTFAEKCWPTWSIPKNINVTGRGVNADSPATCGPDGCDFTAGHGDAGCYRIAMMEDVGGFMAGDAEFSAISSFGTFEANSTIVEAFKADTTKAFVNLPAKCKANPWDRFINNPSSMEDPYSKEKMAFIEWLDTFILGTQSMADSPANDYKYCRHIMRMAYSEDGLLYPQAQGILQHPFNASQPAYPGAGFGELPYWDCMFFGSVSHHEWAQGVYAIQNLKYCPAGDNSGCGIWKGEFPPFKDATNVALPDLPMNILETLSRGFFIKGCVNSDGYMTAKLDATCFAGPCFEGSIPWASEWTCG